MSKEQHRDIPKKYAKVHAAMEDIKSKRAAKKAKAATKAAAADQSNVYELFT